MTAVKVGPVRHAYRRKVVMFVRSMPQTYRAACGCGWESAAVSLTTHQAKAAWRLHVDRAAADIREAANDDRHYGELD